MSNTSTTTGCTHIVRSTNTMATLIGTPFGRTPATTPTGIGELELLVAAPRLGPPQTHCGFALRRQQADRVTIPEIKQLCRLQHWLCCSPPGMFRCAWRAPAVRSGVIFAPAPNFLQTARIFIIAAAIGAVAGAAVCCSLMYQPASEVFSIADRTLVHTVDQLRR